MKQVSTDRIEKTTVLRVPRSRVWRALTDSKEFGSWFGVRMEGAFTAGARVQGAITHPGYEHVIMGHHGGTGLLGRALLGSASQTVLEGADVPLTVVP